MDKGRAVRLVDRIEKLSQKILIAQIRYDTRNANLNNLKDELDDLRDGLAMAHGELMKEVGMNGKDD